MGVAQLTRKQREIAAREELFLQVARDLMVEEGPRGLTMDKVAAACEYSKGTLYHHFSSKEDLLAAVAAQTMEKRIGMFEKAASFAGNPRERLTAIGVAEELFVMQNMADFRIQMAIMQEFVRPAVQPERLNQMDMLDLKCMGITTGITRDAVAHGDLVLPEGTTAEGLTLLLWGSYTGTFSLLSAFEDPCCPIISSLPSDLDPVANLRRNIHLLLDGYGWKPLSTEWDYDATYERIVSTVFSPAP